MRRPTLSPGPPHGWWLRLWGFSPGPLREIPHLLEAPPRDEGTPRTQRGMRRGGTLSFRVLMPTLSLLAILAPRGALTATAVVVKSADAAVYREAIEGFQAVTALSVADLFDLEGDIGNGPAVVRKIKAMPGKPDLIYAVGIYALQALVGQITDIPIVFSMVLNPPVVVGPQIRNITGASMNVPIDVQLRSLKQLAPQVRRIGVVYDPSKTGFLLAAAQRVAPELGLAVVSRPINSPRASVSALEELENRVDALWILPDSTILTPETVQYMLLVAFRRKIPLLGLSDSQAKMGALLAISFRSGHDIGKQAGELAKAILGGRRVDEVPYTMADKTKLTLNLKTAEKIGLQVPPEVIQRADVVIR